MAEPVNPAVQGDMDVALAAINQADVDGEGLSAEDVKAALGWRNWNRLFVTLYGLRDAGLITIRRAGARGRFEHFYANRGGK